MNKMTSKLKPSECINDECDEWHPGLIPEWDGTMPQGQMCQRPDGFARRDPMVSLERDNLGTCGNEAQVGRPYVSWDIDTLEPEYRIRYYCEECFAEAEAEDDILTAYFEGCEELSNNHWCGGMVQDDISRLINLEVTIGDLAIERYTEYATWCIEDGELEEAAKIISRLIDAKGGE